MCYSTESYLPAYSPEHAGPPLDSIPKKSFLPAWVPEISISEIRLSEDSPGVNSDIATLKGRSSIIDDAATPALTTDSVSLSAIAGPSSNASKHNRGDTRDCSKDGKFSRCHGGLNSLQQERLSENMLSYRESAAQDTYQCFRILVYLPGPLAVLKCCFTTPRRRARSSRAFDEEERLPTQGSPAVEASVATRSHGLQRHHVQQIHSEGAVHPHSGEQGSAMTELDTSKRSSPCDSDELLSNNGRDMSGSGQGDAINCAFHIYQMQMLLLEHYNKQRLMTKHQKPHSMGGMSSNSLAVAISNLSTTPLGGSQHESCDAAVPQGPDSPSVQPQSPETPSDSINVASPKEESRKMMANTVESDKEHDPTQLQTAVSKTKAWFAGLKVPDITEAERCGMAENLESGSCHNQASSGCYGSLAEEHSTTTDSDVLSISDTSEPLMGFDTGPLSPMQSHMLDNIWKIWKDYRDPRRCYSGGDTYITPAASTSAISTSGTSQSSLGKRKSNDRHSTTGVDSGPSLKAAKRARDDGIRPKVLACPYWKHNREKYRMCCKLTHKRIRDVKQHLHRRHTPDMYCDRCLEVFDDAERYETHVQSAAACFRVPGSRLAGITRMQSRAISKKSDRNLGEEDQWFTIWDTLFPGSARPASAYVDSELSEEMNSFQEYWTNRGHDILMDELDSNGMWSLTPDEREAQGRQILAGGPNLIYEQWTGLRRNAFVAPPDQSMIASPPLANTPVSSRSHIPDVKHQEHTTNFNTTPPDHNEAASVVTGIAKLDKPQSSGESLPPDPQVLSKSNDAVLQALPLGENSERSAIFERGQTEFADFSFTDLFAVGASQDIPFGFDGVDLTGELNTI